MKNKTLSIFLCTVLAVSMLAGCGRKELPTDIPGFEAASEAATEAAETTAATETAAAETETAAVETEAAATTPTTDRSGNEITVPENVETIVSLAPSTTRILIDLGLADKIIAIDTYSLDYAADLKADLPTFDMMAPDQEQIVALKPDVVFTTGMSSYEGVDAFQGVRDAGVCVADIPSSASLDDIMQDILFIGEVTGETEGAQDLVDAMKSTIDALSEIGASISDDEKKTVLFELYTPSADYPTIYTAGPGTYIDEMMSLIGAVNIAGKEDSQWPALSEEAAVGANPDVILTADMYTPDVINVILTMEGWGEVTAIKDQAVYELDSNSVNQPNHHVVSAMVAMAKAIYPEKYADVTDPFEN